MTEEGILNGEINQLLGLDFPRYLEESVRAIINEHPELAFAQEPVR
jgi:hypothetical protein